MTSVVPNLPPTAAATGVIGYPNEHNCTVMDDPRPSRCRRIALVPEPDRPASTIGATRREPQSGQIKPVVSATRARTNVTQRDTLTFLLLSRLGSDIAIRSLARDAAVPAIVSDSPATICVMAGHTLEQLQAFFAPAADSSTAWACYRTHPGEDGRFVHMAPGQGAQYREDTRAGRYRCLLPDCDGLLRVKAGPVNRHHWAHLVAPNPRHEPESVWHQNAKAALAEFARTQRPNATVHLDTRFTPAGNKPDVWVRVPVSGVPASSSDLDRGLEVAFEAQRSRIGVTELARRNTGYAVDGITAVWLFANLAATTAVFEPDDNSKPRLRLNSAHRELAATGHPLRWLNPDERSVATGYILQVRRPEPRDGEAWATVPGTVTYVRQPDRSDRHCRVRLDALTVCTLDTTGLHTPTDDWITGKAAAAAVEEERLRALARHAATATANRPTPPPERTTWSFADANIPSYPPLPLEPVSQQQPATRASVRSLPTSRPAVGAFRVARTLPTTCRYCHGHIAECREWPSWYLPPATATAVYACVRCQLPVANQ